MSTNASTNHFLDIVTEVQAAPSDKCTEALIDGIAQQMQQSGVGAEQLGSELQSAKPRLVQACQRQQGG